jgi:hypothetical protein
MTSGAGLTRVYATGICAITWRRGTATASTGRCRFTRPRFVASSAPARRREGGDPCDTEGGSRRYRVKPVGNKLRLCVHTASDTITSATRAGRTSKRCVAQPTVARRLPDRGERRGSARNIVPDLNEPARANAAREVGRCSGQQPKIITSSEEC